MARSEGLNPRQPPYRVTVFRQHPQELLREPGSRSDASIAPRQFGDKARPAYFGVRPQEKGDDADGRPRRNQSKGLRDVLVDLCLKPAGCGLYCPPARLIPIVKRVHEYSAGPVVAGYWRISSGLRYGNPRRVTVPRPCFSRRPPRPNLPGAGDTVFKEQKRDLEERLSGRPSNGQPVTMPAAFTRGPGMAGWLGSGSSRTQWLARRAGSAPLEILFQDAHWPLRAHIGYPAMEPLRR